MGKDSGAWRLDLKIESAQPAAPVRMILEIEQKFIALKVIENYPTCRSLFIAQ